MNKIKSAFLISGFIAIILLLYGGLRFILPQILSSKNSVKAIETFIDENTGLTPQIEGLQIRVSPLLSLEIEASSIKAVNKSTPAFNADNLFVKFAPASFKPDKIEINSLYFDKTAMPEIKKKSKSSNLNIKNLPQINVKKAFIVIKHEADNKNAQIEVNDLNLTDKYMSFKSIIKIPQIRHDIIIDSEKNLFFENNSLCLYGLNISTENACLHVNGNINGSKYNLDISGNDFCINALEKSFLFFIKQKNPSKNFIENFYDFSGKADIKISITNLGINGNITLKNFKAKTVKFSVPLFFPAAEFVFKNNTAALKANGNIGGEPVYTDLDIKDLLSNKKIKGSVKTIFTGKFFDKYIPAYKLNGQIGFLLNYSVYNHKITVEYLANIPNGSELKYKDSNLGLSGNNRRIYAKTFKDGNNLYLKSYDYSLTDNNNVQNIITGDGLFVKKNGKFKLDYMTCKTNGDAPVSVIGSFSRFVAGGTFNGNFKYTGENALPAGNFRLNNSRYKNFYIKDAQINSNEKNMLITASGTYEKEPYKALLDINNNFENKILVNNIDLYLKEFTIKKTGSTKKAVISDNIKENIRDLDWEVKKGHVKLDEIRHNNIVLNNAELIVNGNNNLVSFTMPGTKFADGTLSASGKYDLNKHNSDICFSALNINSNLAAGMVFGLYNQVEGYANARMHFKSFNKLDTIKAHSSFSIENGALTKIGSTEFMIKKNKRINRNINFKLTDITNIDIKKMEALKSNINGKIDINNHEIENAELYAKHKFLSLFAEGSYDIDEQDANINVWGAYNKDAQKGIKILFVPLSLITRIVLRPEDSMAAYSKQINKIPAIDADNTQKEIFRVNMKGNLNDSSSVKVKLKRIK